MRFHSQLSTRNLPNRLFAYGLGSLMLAGFYWAFICYVDSLPCREILCNFEWLLIFFGPVLIVFAAAPPINYGLLHLDGRNKVARASGTRLFFSAIGTGFSVLVIASFIDGFDSAALGFADLSPESLSYAALFAGLTWLNLSCAWRLLRRQADRAP